MDTSRHLYINCIDGAQNGFTSKKDQSQECTDLGRSYHLNLTYIVAPDGIDQYSRRNRRKQFTLPQKLDAAREIKRERVSIYNEMGVESLPAENLENTCNLEHNQKIGSFNIFASDPKRPRFSVGDTWKSYLIASLAEGTSESCNDIIHQDNEVKLNSSVGAHNVLTKEFDTHSCPMKCNEPGGLSCKTKPLPQNANAGNQVTNEHDGLDDQLTTEANILSLALLNQLGISLGENTTDAGLTSPHCLNYFPSTFSLEALGNADQNNYRSSEKNKRVHNLPADITYDDCPALAKIGCTEARMDPYGFTDDGYTNGLGASEPMRCRFNIGHISPCDNDWFHKICVARTSPMNLNSIGALCDLFSPAVIKSDKDAVSRLFAPLKDGEQYSALLHEMLSMFIPPCPRSVRCLETPTMKADFITDTFQYCQSVRFEGKEYKNRLSPQSVDSENRLEGEQTEALSLVIEKPTVSTSTITCNSERKSILNSSSSPDVSSRRGTKVTDTNLYSSENHGSRRAMTGYQSTYDYSKHDRSSKCETPLNWSNSAAFDEKKRFSGEHNPTVIPISSNIDTSQESTVTPLSSTPCSTMTVAELVNSTKNPITYNNMNSIGSENSSPSPPSLCLPSEAYKDVGDIQQNRVENKPASISNLPLHISSSHCSYYLQYLLMQEIKRLLTVLTRIPCVFTAADQSHDSREWADCQPFLSMPCSKIGVNGDISQSMWTKIDVLSSEGSYDDHPVFVTNCTTMNNQKNNCNNQLADKVQSQYKREIITNVLPESSQALEVTGTADDSSPDDVSNLNETRKFDTRPLMRYRLHENTSLATSQCVQITSDKVEHTINEDLRQGMTTTLTPVHLRKAKLMFFYTRYPNSPLIKQYFPDVKFYKNNTAQLVKWFSNFREFYYIQMEKFARLAISKGTMKAEDITVDVESELYRTLKSHYNRNQQFEVPDHFRFVVEATLKEFFNAIRTGKDAEQSWKKPIYKVIARMDQHIPECFKHSNWLEQLTEN